ncbi:MAG: hypothetical protein ATN36_05680 [Epulopiscium sp. Nele67-Bin005]|nr:MAG: hypothetical protein ATN36_05680 [Epulopiscium sp. Nele67-Bin005]
MEIIIGELGSGKTHHCYEMIKDCLKINPFQRLIVIVPEQFNLQTQRELANKLYPGLFSVEVISFKNLVQHISINNNLSKFPIIDDLERMMIIKKLLEQHKKKLDFYGKSYNQEGFVEHINRLITICEQNGVGQELLTFLKKEENDSSILNIKLQDLDKIYGWFNDYVENKFLTLEGSVILLAKQLAQDPQFKNTKIWIDGFFGFTEGQFQVINQLNLQAEMLTITLPMDKIYTQDEEIKQNNLFYSSIKTLHKLQNINNQSNFNIHLCENEQRNVNPDVWKLHKYYLTINKEETPTKSDNVKLNIYPTIAIEIEKVAQQIHHYIFEQNYRYNEIAILVGDINRYQPYIGSVFEEYNIPYFLDMKRDVQTNNLVSVIISLLDVVTTGWSYPSVMALLKTQMLPFTQDEIDYLDNYLLAYGIRFRNRWENEWTYGEKDWDLDLLNDTRVRFWNLIKLVENAIKSDGSTSKISVFHMTRIVYAFLKKIDAYTSVQKTVEYYKEQNNLSLQIENEQIYSQVIEVIDRLVETLGDEQVTLTAYKQILKISFTYIKMGIIPPSYDQIIIGEVERTKLPQLKIIFILGMNDGILPKHSQSPTLFSEMDYVSLREICQNNEAKTTNFYEAFIGNQLFSNEFLIYTALTRAKNKIIISAISMEEDGKPLKPSPLFINFNQMFELEDKYSEELLFTPQSTLNKLSLPIKHFLENQSQDTQWRDILSWYLTNENWKNKATLLIQNLLYSNKQNKLLPATSKTLHSKEIVTNVSKLEKFRKCACNYFIEYNLKAKDREIFEWSTSDVGTIFHNVLEEYPKELDKIHKEWTTVNKTEQEQCLLNAIDKSIAKYNSQHIEGGRLKHMTNQIQNMCKRAINALTYHLEEGKFQPQNYELSFKEGIENTGKFGSVMPPIIIQLDNEHTIKLEGKIDRIDIYISEDDNKNYIKIIDYKSGKTSFELLELFYGLQFQLLLYLDAYLKNTPDTNPAGMFYFRLKTNYASYEQGKTSQTLQKANLDAYKLSGLTVDNQEVVKAFDEEITGTIIPVKAKKDGWTAFSKIATEEQFDNLRTYVTDKIKELSQSILDGEISANPCQLGDKSPCTYCKYPTICQFDVNDKNNKAQILPKLSEHEIWEEIESYTKGENDEQ